MRTKPTCGPWVVVETEGGLVIREGDKDGFTIAVMPNRKPRDPYDNAQADADLLAAAPTMLGLLKRVWNGKGTYGDLIAVETFINSLEG